jgi:hypothetical protein
MLRALLVCPVVVLHSAGDIDPAPLVEIFRDYLRALPKNDAIEEVRRRSSVLLRVTIHRNRKFDDRHVSVFRLRRPALRILRQAPA